MLRRIFGPKRKDVTGEWRKIHYDKHHNILSSPNIIRVTKSKGMIWAGNASPMGEMTNTYEILIGNPEGKRHRHG